MDLRQLRYFVAIVEQRSFSKAAVALNVAQPALSLHVRNMEAELETSLLYRTQQGVKTTDAGAILLRNARTIIDQFATTQEEIKGNRAEPSGEVRVGLPGTISQVLSASLIMAARKRFPKIRLRIAEAMSGFVNEWIRDGRVDLAALYSPLNDRTVSSYPVLAEQLCLLGPTVSAEPHASFGSQSIEFPDIAQLSLVLPSPTHGLRQLLESEAADLDIKLNIEIEVDSFASIKELVEKGAGYSILPFNAVCREVDEGRLQTWRFCRDLRRNLHLVRATERPTTVAVSAIEELCRDVLLDLVQTGQWRGAEPILNPQPDSCNVIKATIAAPVSGPSDVGQPTASWPRHNNIR